MFHRLFLIVGMILYCASIIGAQKGYFGFQTVRSDKDFAFPIFYKNHRDPVASKINRFLQLSELYFIARPPYSTRIFEHAKANDGSIYGGKVSLWTTVHSNNKRVVSLGIDQSACGATCGYRKTYYTFNSGNGDRISLADIFEPSGYKRFFKAVLQRRTLKYRREVKRKIEPQYQEGYLGTLGCFEVDDLSGFYIRGNAIVIDGDSCLVKGQKFDGLDMKVAIGLSAFKHFLNDYGRAIFGIDRSNLSRFRSTKLPQLLEGNVDGSYPIVMVLSKDFENEYQGFYAYLKHGEALSLKGSQVEDKIELTERVLSPFVTDGPMGEIRRAVESGFISGRLNDRVFEGIWTDASKSKTLTFEASIR